MKPKEYCSCKHIYNFRNKLKRKKTNLSIGVSIILAFSFSSTQFVHAEWVEFINDASINIIHSDNINTSAFSADAESDTSINPAYTFGRFYQVNDLTRLRLALDLSADYFDDFNKFDSTEIKGSAMLLHKFGVGFKKPWVRGHVSVGLKETEIDWRDSDLLEVGIASGKRFNERLSGKVGVKFNKREGGSGVIAVPGKPSNVADIESTSLSFDIDYLLSERSQISAGFTHRNGDFDSACTVENVAIVLENENVDAITLDDVFGGCAYRLNGSSNALKLQYSYALGRHSSLNVGYEVREGKADVLEYDTALWNTSFMYSR